MTGFIPQIGGDFGLLLRERDKNDAHLDEFLPHPRDIGLTSQ
jgi:hypothetical protein